MTHPRFPLDMSQLDRQLIILCDCLKQPDTEQGATQQAELIKLLPELRTQLQARVTELEQQEGFQNTANFERLNEIHGEMTLLGACYIECLKIWGRVKERGNQGRGGSDISDPMEVEELRG